MKKSTRRVGSSCVSPGFGQPKVLHWDVCLDLPERERQEQETGCIVLERTSKGGEANVCVFCTHTE